MSRTRRRLAFAATSLLLSLWLPVALLALALVRFPGMPGAEGVGLPPWSAVPKLLPVWFAGLPLTFALRLLHRRSRAVAIVCGVALVPISAYAVMLGGLFGPPGILLYAALASLPAWIALAVLRFAGAGRR